MEQEKNESKRKGGESASLTVRLKEKINGYLNEEGRTHSIIYHLSEGRDTFSIFFLEWHGDACLRLSWYKDERCMYLTDLHVEESKRGKGLASFLMKDAIEISRRCGMESIVLNVIKDSWVQKWYEQLGFVTACKCKQRPGYMVMKKILIQKFKARNK